MSLCDAEKTLTIVSVFSAKLMRFVRIFSVGIVYTAFFLHSTNPILAAFTFNIESVEPSSVSSKTEEVTVTLAIEDLPSESYFRVAWQAGSGKPYFGYIKNKNNKWVKIKALSDDCSEYYRVTDVSTTSATLRTKIGEDNEIQPGVYLLKAHRFTIGGCSVKASDNEMEISVVIPSSTPTPTKTPTPTSTPKPTGTPRPTVTLKPAKSPKPTKTPKPTRTPVAKKSMDSATDSDSQPTKTDRGAVLGGRAKREIDIFLPTASPSALPTANLENPQATVAGKSRKKLPYVFFFLGGLSLVGAAVSAYKIAKNPLA